MVGKQVYAFDTILFRQHEYFPKRILIEIETGDYRYTDRYFISALTGYIPKIREDRIQVRSGFFLK